MTTPSKFTSSSSHSFRVLRCICVGRVSSVTVLMQSYTAQRNLGTEMLQELELELIQTQIAQKPMLRAEVCARALRASLNVKESGGTCKDYMNAGHVDDAA